MDTLSPSFGTETESADTMDLTSLPADEQGRREWLIRTFGEAFCRTLGIYRLPDDLTLSVVIPVYNERNTIHEILAPGPCRADPQADHPRR